MWNLWVATLASGCTILQLDANPGYPEAGSAVRFRRARARNLPRAPARRTCPRASRPGSLQAGTTISPRSARSGQPDRHCRRRRTAGRTPARERGHAARRHLRRDRSGRGLLDLLPILPVHAGEMQCRGLGVALHALDNSGRELMDEVGELVVTKPMPSMPLYFSGDEDGKRYHESYFETYPGLLSPRRLATTYPAAGVRHRHHLRPVRFHHQSSRAPHGLQRDLPGSGGVPRGARLAGNRP